MSRIPAESGTFIRRAHLQLPLMTTQAERLQVTLSYSDDPHMSQIFTGFQMLEASGVVRLLWEPGPPGDLPGCVSAALDSDGNRVLVHYDILDGLNWIPGEEQANLEFLASSAPAGVIFKRSYRSDLVDRVPVGTTILPLGLNYQVSPPYNPIKRGLRVRMERSVRDSRWLSRILRVQPATHPVDVYEAAPQLQGPFRVMMYTRLWDPQGSDVRTPEEALERESINAARVETLLALRKDLGGRFTGGLYRDAYSESYATSDLLLPWVATEKVAYLRSMKRHAICLATAGLHGSTGWRFAEYVAASRAVITEPLQFDPGPGLVAEQHYIEAPLDALGDAVSSLLSDPERIRRMMRANFRHYRSSLRPDALILATLEQALAVAARPQAP